MTKDDLLSEQIQSLIKQRTGVFEKMLQLDFGTVSAEKKETSLERTMKAIDQRIDLMFDKMSHD